MTVEVTVLADCVTVEVTVEAGDVGHEEVTVEVTVLADCVTVEVTIEVVPGAVTVDTTVVGTVTVFVHEEVYVVPIVLYHEVLVYILV